MTPFFSIIIPVYNVAPYLRECLDSVLAQTFADWEAICVDDGSTDGSGAILDEYAAKDNRFRVIHQPNAGVSAARNSGMDVALTTQDKLNANVNGWITFLDGDDRFDKSFLECVGSAITKNTDLVVGNIYQNAHYRFYCEKAVDVLVSSETIIKRGMLRNTFAWSRCYKMSICRLNNIRFDEQVKFSEDVLFNLDYLQHVKYVSYAGDHGYWYRSNPTSAASKLYHCDSYVSTAKKILRLFDILCLKNQGLSEYANWFWGISFLGHIRLALLSAIKNNEPIDKKKDLIDCFFSSRDGLLARVKDSRPLKRALVRLLLALPTCARVRTLPLWISRI